MMGVDGAEERSEWLGEISMQCYAAVYLVHRLINIYI
jgi:hypothetical protein